MSRSQRLAPNRPSLGPLFSACALAWVAALVVESCSWDLYVSAPAWRVAGPLAATLACAGIACALGARAGAFRLRAPSPRGTLRSMAVPCLGLIGSLVCSALFWGAWQGDVSALQERLASPEGVAVELVGDPTERDYGTVSVARWDSGPRGIAFRLLWPEGTAPLKAGHRVIVTGSLSVPAADEGGRWNHRQGYVGMLGAESVTDAGFAEGLSGLVCGFRDRAAARIAQEAGDDEAAAGLLAGVVLGDRTIYAGTELEQDFRTTGLAHLMAVSGTHLAVVAALLSWLLARTGLGRSARCALVTACLVLYVALTGFAPSALRAFAMCSAALCAGLLGRRGHVVSALSLCVLLFVCAEPPIAFSLGFQLSVLAVLGLVGLSPLASTWLRAVLPARLAGVADSAGATLSATLVTLPVTVPLFAQLPLVTPLATFLAAPLVTAALAAGIPGVLLAATGLPLCGLPLDCALALAAVCSALVHALADLPLACVPMSSDGVLVGLALACALAVLWARWPLPAQDSLPAGVSARRGPARGLRHAVVVAGALLLPLLLVVFEGLGGAPALQRALAPGFSSGAQVVMVDVGQGDCMLVRDGDAAVLIDTGEDGSVLERGLARQGVTRLDAVYLTHKDADHCGALSALTGVVRVDHVFVHADLLGNPGMERVLRDARWVTGGRGAEGVRVGHRTRIGRFALTLVAPQRGGDSGNDDSLVNLLEYDEEGDGIPEARGLLTGDAEREATEPLAARIGRIDVLKVAHHGSRGGASDAELAVLSPKVALIGVGADNRYGHPTRDTLDQLFRAGAQVYRTDLNGDVTVSFAGNAMSVKLQKED